jgi:DNA-binding LacI/PurR family transcriptional regulator
MAAASTPPQVTPTPRPPRTAHEIRSVAVRAHRDPRTVAAAYDPAARVTDVARAAVAAAASDLGYAPPPERG